MSSPRLCVICCWLIEEERIEHVPHTRLCAVHVHAIEPYGGEMRVQIASPRREFSGRLHPPFQATPFVRRTRNEDAMNRLSEDFVAQREAKIASLGNYSPEWRTADVLALARAVASESDPALLPVLRDAVMEAGCENQAFLDWLQAADRSLTPSCVLIFITGFSQSAGT